jgi:hypothetical protein
MTGMKPAAPPGLSVVIVPYDANASAAGLFIFPKNRYKYN